MDNLIIDLPQSWRKFFAPANKEHLAIKTVEFYKLAAELFSFHYQSESPNISVTAHLHHLVFNEVTIGPDGRLIIGELFQALFEDQPDAYFDYIESLDIVYFSAIDHLIESENFLSAELREVTHRLTRPKLLILDLLKEVFRHCQDFPLERDSDLSKG